MLRFIDLYYLHHLRMDRKFKWALSKIYERILSELLQFFIEEESVLSLAI